MSELNAPRVVLLTSSEPRHRYVASVVGQALEFGGLVIETKRPRSGLSTAASAEDAQVLKLHYEERDAAEERYFGTVAYPEIDTIRIPTGTVNDSDTVDWVRAREPDFVLLYGTGIVKSPILDTWGDRVINMHLGLSPYYRGAGTNFWPLCNGEPECVGVTVHIAVAEVDAGPILGQCRPDDLDPGDGAHEFGCKSIIAGARLLARSVSRLHAGELVPVPQTGGGRVYRAADFGAEAVRKMRSNLASGMVPEYLAEKALRDARFPIREG